MLTQSIPCLRNLFQVCVRGFFDGPTDDELFDITYKSQKLDALRPAEERSEEVWNWIKVAR